MGILRTASIAALLALGFATLTGAAPAPVDTKAVADKKAPATPQEILDTAPATAWRDIAADDMVVMTLADGTQVVYQLAAKFAPVHVANIRQLVRSGYFDGAIILRVQDDYVVQWGRPDDDKTVAQGIEKHPPAEYEFPAKGAGFKALPWPDAYALHTGHIDSWPAATDGKSDWLVHCYGMIGVARDVAPDTGDSTQLYTVIGHAPRHLDRNLAVVGRIIKGMDTLAARPRGTEELGFYKAGAPEATKIVSAKMASDLPVADRPAFQVLDSDTPTFSTWLQAKANRTGAFFVRPAGALDLCNALPAIRKHP